MASNTPILLIPSESLTKGSSYSFQIKSLNDLSSSVFTINTYTPPSCSSISSNISSGTFLNDVFNIYVSSCLPADVTGFPLMYVLNAIVGYTVTPLQLFSYSFSFSSYLMPNQNYYSITVCDSENICNDFQINIQVAGQLTYSNDLSAVYQKEGFGAVISLCRNFEIGLPLIQQMWTDLLNLYESSYFKQKIANIFIASTSSLLLQSNFAKQYSVTAILQLKTLIQQIKIDNTTMSLCAEISYGMKTLYSTDKNSLNITNDLLINCISLYTKNFIPGNSYTFLNTQIALYKYTGMVKNFLSQKYTIQNRAISIPSNLPISDTTIVNLYLILYPSAGNYSDVLDYRFTSTGSYSNLAFVFSKETDINLKNLGNPITFQLNFQRSVLNE